MTKRLDRIRTSRDEAPMVAFAAIFSEPARAAMAIALMDGRAQTAKELAFRAAIAPSTASFHLALLERHGIVTRCQQGRNHYFRLADSQIAQFVEQLMVVAETLDVRGLATGPKDPALRRARCCWNHAAGRLGVAIADRLLEEGSVALDGDRFLPTRNRGAFLRALIGEDGTHYAACRACLDWSERRPHLGGPLGTAILAALVERGSSRGRAIRAGLW